MMENHSKKLAKILLVDDSDADILFAKVRLQKENISVSLEVAHDGSEAVDYLRAVPFSTDSKRPDLIIMDLCMPQMDGLEALSILRNDKDLYDIPVVICSGSDDAEDIRRSMRLGAVDYIVKPLDYFKLEEVIEKVPGLYVEEEEGNRVIYKQQQIKYEEVA